MNKKRRKKVVLLLDKEEAKREENRAQRAKDLQKRIDATKKEIKKIQGRYPEKSLIQLLRRIRLESGLLAGMLTILRIERNQKDNLSLEDQAFLREERNLIKKGDPQLESSLKTDCPSRV
jgi:hypothetical protein